MDETDEVPAFEPDIDAFVAFLRDEAGKADDDYLNEERAVAIGAYNGDPYGDEEDGRSQVVTRDVAEVIDYMTVSLLRTMVSGDNVVEFEHQDTASAQAATAAVTREFFQGQNGYRFLHDWIKAGLLEKTSLAKVCVEEQPDKRVEQDVPIELLPTIEGIIAAEQIDESTFRIAVSVPQPPKFRDYVVANEEVRVAADARELGECVYLGLASEKSLSDLAEMGFDTDDIAGDDYSQSNTLSQARDYLGLDLRHDRQGVNRLVWFIEEYSRYDLNGDGIAETILSHRVGSDILRKKDGTLSIEEVDEHPGVEWCPFPMQHRRVGQSLADKCMDIQRTRTVLMRQALDNLYLSNAPRVAISESSIGDSTIDDLLTIRPGGLVRHIGAVAPQPWQVPFVAGHAFDAMEVLAGEKESRTGITRLNQGLDADALNKTATGTAMMQAQGQQMEEYLARNFAEAFATLMLKKYRLMRKFGKPMQIMVDGQMVETDPAQWPDDMNVQVRVGLGSGRKDQRLQYRMTVLQIMRELVVNGSKIVGDEQLYNMVKGVVADANLGSVRDYLIDPSTLGETPEKPDPKMMEAQAKAMIEAEKVKLDREKWQGDTQLKLQQQQVDAALKQQALEADLQAKREKQALDEQLARDKAIFEANLATQKADREYDLAVMRLNREAALADARSDLPSNRPGGALDE